MNSDAMTGRRRVRRTREAAGRISPGGQPAAPSLRQLTPPASLLLVAAAGAWAGVVLVARDMGAMPEHGPGCRFVRRRLGTEMAR